MDAVWLGRLRWRRRGAWLWPAFVTAVVVDALVGHWLPPAGDAVTETPIASGLVGLYLNLIGVVLLSWPIGLALRRLRPDLPMVVARNYGGTVVVVAVTITLLTVGLFHHAAVMADRSALRDAVTRAQAWIGARAPAVFRRNVEYVSTFAIEPGRLYRTCVPSIGGGPRTYCVIVDVKLPFASSVRFSGYEPNSVFGEGVG
jgi:hypothetical protein